MNTILIIIGVFVFVIAATAYPKEFFGTFNIVAWLGRKHGERLARKRDKEMDKRLISAEKERQKIHACQLAMKRVGVPYGKEDEFMAGCLAELDREEKKNELNVKKIFKYPLLVVAGGLVGIMLFNKIKNRK